MRKRWATEEGRALASEAWKRLLAGRPLDGLGLGEHKGRVDLRGLPGTDAWVTATWEGLDLTEAGLRFARFKDAVLRDCVFEVADFDNGGFWGCDVADCSFAGAGLTNLVLGGTVGRFRKRGCRWTKVDFRKADLRGSFPTRAAFVDCDFRGIKVTDFFQFNDATYIRCRFGGRLVEPQFMASAGHRGPVDPERVTDCDFSEAELVWSDFRGLNLRGVVWPDDERHIVVHDFRAALERAMAELEGMEGDMADDVLQVLRIRAQYVGPAQESGIFHEREFLDHGGSPSHVALARQVLRPGLP